MCGGRERGTSNPVTGKPSPRVARCPLETGPVSARPAVVPEMAAGVKASLHAYPVTGFPKIVHLSPFSVTASVDSLCGEALTASLAVGRGGCGQKLARMSAWLRAPGCATPTLSTVSARPFTRSRVRLHADVTVAHRGVTASSAYSRPAGATPVTGAVCAERAGFSAPFQLTGARGTGAVCPHGTVRPTQDCIHTRTCQGG